MKITIKFGSRTVVESTGENQKDAMLGLGVFGDTEAKCGNCGSDEILPKARRTSQGHTYFELKCAKCGHVLSLGQNKDGEGLFPKDGWQPPYQGNHDDGPPPQRTGPQSASQFDDDEEAPF